MALGVDVAALALAFVLTVIEMTEVVALVFALGAESGSHREAAGGAVVGVAAVAAVAAVVGVGLEALPRAPLLAGAAVTLAAFGVFLFRSTRRTYRRLRHPSEAAAPGHRAVAFAGGATVGAVEATEVVVVLVALAAAGQGRSALLGAVLGGGLLVALALAVHERMRRIKVPTLKLAATGALFAFAAFWAGEALGVSWPGPEALADLWLLPLFVVSVGGVRLLLALDASRDLPVGAKG